MKGDKITSKVIAHFKDLLRNKDKLSMCDLDSMECRLKVEMACITVWGYQKDICEDLLREVSDEIAERCLLEVEA